jgi:hypothetical protein
MPNKNLHMKFCFWNLNQADFIKVFSPIRETAKCLLIVSSIVISLLISACSHRLAVSSLKSDLIEAQKALIIANNAADVSAVEYLTANEWTGIAASGVSRTKVQLRDEITKRGPAKIQATAQQLADRQKEWLVHVSKNVGVVTRLTAGDHGTPSWITTIWIYRDGRWQRIISQDTKVQNP